MNLWCNGNGSTIDSMSKNMCSNQTRFTHFCNTLETTCASCLHIWRQIKQVAFRFGDNLG